jgi:hypothetical protein
MAAKTVVLVTRVAFHEDGVDSVHDSGATKDLDDVEDAALLDSLLEQGLAVLA